ncbi:hypothetical protein [Rhizohabitans arisaemae]|uniref:hypothetical protein n=1 Tax=Rhizohabitans arisaemae TaxID=2720610 RepID=UPI0024B17626|nr:hypothetical protein [Rhizohabitans arisaemae]
MGVDSGDIHSVDGWRLFSVDNGRAVSPRQEDLLLDPEYQARAASGKAAPVEGGPWEAGSELVEGYLRRVVADLHRGPELLVHHAEFDNYGSGYASYVDVLLTRRDGTARRVGPGGGIEVQGITLLLCRLAPVACVMTGERTDDSSGGMRSMPTAERAARMPLRGWDRGCEQVTRVLERHGITCADPELLRRRALPDLRVDGVLGDPPYLVYDVWFHWAD